MKRWLVPLGSVFGGMALMAAVIWCFLNQQPRMLWNTGPGQAVTLALLRGTQPAAKGTARVRPGDAFPALTVRTLDDTPTTLRLRRGRRTIVNFWATWCGPCLAEMPLLDAAARRGEIDVIGVASDEALTDVKRRLAEHPVSYPIVWSPSGTGSAQAQVGGSGGPALPFSVLVDEQGLIRKARVISFDPGEVERWAR